MMRYLPNTHSRMITAGEDHLVRLLPTEATADVVPAVIEDATHPLTWIDLDATYLVTASEDGVVRLYRHATGPALVHIVRREVLPVRGVALERATNSPRVAICSDELIVRVVNAADPRSITLLTGHSRGVRAASWSPILPLLATCGSDGDMRLWDMSSDEHICVKVVSGQLPALRPESELTSLACWHPSGAYLALPLRTQEIALVRTPARREDVRRSDMWTTLAVLGPASGTLSAEQRAPSGLVSALAFSPNGRYLAAATEDAQVTIWAMDSRRVVRTQRAEALVTGLAWHPAKDVLAWTDTQGQLVRWDGTLGATLPSGWEPVEVPVDGPVSTAGRAPSGAPGELDDELDDLFDDTLLDGEEEQRASHAAGTLRRAPADLTLEQPVIQPGATPMMAQRRFLCASPIGTLVAVDQDTHQTIVFESYDTSSRRNYRFTDHYGYKYASMAPQGVLFACDAEAGSPSVVFYRPFDDIPGIQSEWSLSLPAGETAMAVALGGVPNVGSHADMHVPGPSGVVDEARTSAVTSVVATSRGLLRFFGASGMQRYVWALGLPVVALAAGAHSLLVVHRVATTSAAHVHLGYLLIELAELSVMQQGSVPLPADNTLVWAGVDELGAPALFDSSGMLYMLDRAWRPGQGRWVPALDTAVALLPRSAESGDAVPRVRCWPIAVSSTHLFGLLVPASQRFPSASNARPLVQELALEICLAQRDSTATPLEETALRRALLAGATRDARAALGMDVVPQRLGPAGEPGVLDMEADKSLLQLVQLACKADRYARALDATRALHSEATLDAALKIASFFHLPSLADRLEQVRAPLAVRAQFAPELTERACGTDALLRNTVRMPAAALPTPAVASAAAAEADSARGALQQDGFAKRAPRPSASMLAREGIAHQRATDLDQPSESAAASSSLPPSSLPLTEPNASSSGGMGNDSWRESSPAPTWAEPVGPRATPRANPFARTHSAARERELHKSESFFDRVEAPKRKGGDETPRSEKRVASSERQSTLASFAYERPSGSDATE